MSKKLFIQTINSMVDMETIFIAHPSYWSDVYDRMATTAERHANRRLTKDEQSLAEVS